MPARTLGGLARSTQSARLRLNFKQCDTAVDPRITVTRASTTWRVNSAGVYVPVAANAPVIEYNPLTLANRGLRVRPATTNLLTYSEDIGNAAYSKGGATVGASSSARGITLKKLTESALNEEHYVYSPVAVVTGGATIAGSVFVMAAGSTFCQVRLTSYNGTYSAASAFPNLTNGTQRNACQLLGGAVSGAVTIEDWGGGLYRIGIVGVLASNVTQAGIVVYLQRAAGAFTETTYLGDGSTGTYLGGFMLRQGSTLGNYIPTTSAQVTVDKDVLALTGANFTSWFNQNEGTFVVKSSRAAAGVAAGQYFLLAAEDNTGNDSDNLIGISSQYGTDVQAAFVVAGGVVACEFLETSDTSSRKYALAYKANQFAYASTGKTLATDASGSVPGNLALMNIGSRPGYGNAGQLDGYIEELDFYGYAKPTHEVLEAVA